MQRKMSSGKIKQAVGTSISIRYSIVYLHIVQERVRSLFPRVYKGLHLCQAETESMVEFEQDSKGWGTAFEKDSSSLR